MAPEERVGTERLLQTFERRFLASRALRSFPWQSLEEELRGPSGSKLLLDLVQRTARHPLCVKHPPSGTYVRRFLSELIRKHEAVHAEPLDELYEALAEVLATEESTQCHRSYLLPSGDAVTLTESTAIVAHGTTGLVTWDAALYLAEWAVQNPAAFAHRTVLELGSGAGLTGLAICRTCHPRAFVFSDCHSRVLEQLRQNVALNGFSLEPDMTADPRHPAVTVAQLDWDVATDLQLSAFQPDVVIAAELGLWSWAPQWPGPQPLQAWLTETDERMPPTANTSRSQAASQRRPCLIKTLPLGPGAGKHSLKNPCEWQQVFSPSVAHG
nr:protein-lysine N-methyltransferase EEF2KMT isoform X2 [Oryctolagus cuniculus]